MSIKNGTLKNTEQTSNLFLTLAVSDILKGEGKMNKHKIKMAEAIIFSIHSEANVGAPLFYFNLCEFSEYQTYLYSSRRI